MDIKNVKITDIKEYDKNPRFNDNAVKYVAKSIQEFGFKVPIIIDKDNVIVAGHTRKRAAEKLKLKEVPVIVADDLTDDQIKAFRLADNKVAEYSEWDMDLLLGEIDDIDLDMDEFGFDDLIEEVEEEVEEDDYDEEVPVEPTSKLGDVYQLGRHRLMCGDSTIQTDVDKLVGGNVMHATFTDPPYNIDYKGVSDDRKIKNDRMSDEDFTQFIQDSVMPLDIMYVCCSWQYSHLFKKAMENIGKKPKAMIIWDKVNPAQHLDRYYKQHEIIWYYGPFGGEKTVRGDVWEVKRQRNTVHPTMKPIELIELALRDNPEAKNIYDGFGGSGSTLMTCEQMNKTCYTMELDPKYVDVIINRWEQYTGDKAVLLNDN